MKLVKEIIIGLTHRSIRPSRATDGLWVFIIGIFLVIKVFGFWVFIGAILITWLFNYLGDWLNKRDI